jgi:hypothetical protein
MFGGYMCQKHLTRTNYSNYLTNYTAVKQGRRFHNDGLSREVKKIKICTHQHHLHHLYLIDCSASRKDSGSTTSLRISFEIISSTLPRQPKGSSASSRRRHWRMTSASPEWWWCTLPKKSAVLQYARIASWPLSHLHHMKIILQKHFNYC